MAGRLFSVAVLILMFTIIFNVPCLLDAGDEHRSTEIKTKTFVSESLLQTADKLQGSKLTANPGFGKIPLCFIPNEGQVDAMAKFYAKTSNYTLWMTGDGLVFDKTRSVGAGYTRRRKKESVASKVGGVSAPRPSLLVTGSNKESGHATEATGRKCFSGSGIGRDPSLKESGHRDPSHKSGHPEHSLRTGIDPSNIGSGRGDGSHNPSHKDTTYERNVSRLMFIGANEDAEMTAGAVTNHRVNYFIGNDKSKWHSDIETSKSVMYKKIYDGIDLKIYGIEKQIEYDWIVHPGADPAKISFKYENVESTKIDKDGNLVVTTDFGDLVHSRPVSYQVIEEKKIDVEVTFKKMKDGSFGFEASEYDARYKIVIDPVILEYSTYLGGSGEDKGRAIAVDSSGSAYVTGRTYSTNFPLQNQYQGDQGGDDVFVTKLSPAGNSLTYSTYLGGSGEDKGYGIAVDSSGSAYVTGYTGSTNFPLQNAYQGDQGDWDVFVTKFSPAGNSLTYSTYLGGSGEDKGYGIAVDSSGSAYVTGDTHSTNFPLQNAYQGTNVGIFNAFVTKLSPAGNSLAYSTYLGGSFFDQGRGIAVDSSGSAYVTGFTSSTNFPLQNEYQVDQGGRDAFVTKLSPPGNSLTYSTYLGGSGGEFGCGIDVDSSGSAYVTGFSHSTNFPKAFPYQKYQGGGDVFVTKLSPAGDSLVYSTYIGGSSFDYGYGIAVDSNQSAYVTGYTSSSNFPLQNEYQGDQGGTDVFVTKLSPAGNSLTYSTYLGGGGDDQGYGIAVDSSGSTYVTGYTDSTNFPTLNAYQAAIAGGEDAFVSKLTWQNPNTAPVAVINADYYGGIAPAIINFDGSSSRDADGTVISWQWGFGDGTNGTGEFISHEYPSAGTYTVTLQVRDNDNEWSAIASKQIRIFNSNELSGSLASAPESIKANGRETAVIRAVLYYAASDGSSGTPILENMKLSFSATSGIFFGTNQFDTATGEYSDTLISGSPGTATITASLGGKEICSSSIEYTWPQPPVNLEAEFKENRGLFVGEYRVFLTWAANSADIYTPAQYRIYRLSTDSETWEMVGTVDSSTLYFTDTGVDPKHQYRYGVTTVDTEGDESEKVIAEF